MAFSLTKVGGKVELLIDNLATYVAPNNIDLDYKVIDDTISIRIKSSNYFTIKNVPKAQVTIAGVVITSYAVFKTQLAVAFP